MSDAAPQPERDPDVVADVVTDVVADNAADPVADRPHALRRLLLATVASLLIHLMLAGGLATTTLGTLAGPARDPAAIKAVLKPKVAVDFPLQVPQSPSEKAAHERPQDLRIRPDASKAARKPELRPRDDRSVARDRPREPEERIAASAAPLERSKTPREPVREPPPAPAAAMARQAVATPSVEPKAVADLSAITPAKDAAAAAAKPRAAERPQPAEPAAATTQSRQPREVAILTKPKATADPGQLPSLRDRPADAATSPTAARPLNRAAATAAAATPAATAAAIAAAVPAAQASGGPQAPAPASTAGPSARRPQPIRAADRSATAFDEPAPTAAGRTSADAVRAIARAAGPSRAATEPAATIAATNAMKRAAVVGDSPAGGGETTVAPIAMPAVGRSANPGATGDGAMAGAPPGPAAAVPLATRAGDRGAALSGGGAANAAAQEPTGDEATVGRPGVGAAATPLAVAPGLASRDADRDGGGEIGLPAAGPPVASPGRAAVLADTGPVADDPAATADELPAGSVAPSSPVSEGPGANAGEGWQPARIARSEPAPSAALASVGGRGAAPAEDEGLSREAAAPAADPLAAGLPRDVGPRRDADGDEAAAVPAPSVAPLSRVAAVVLPVEGRVREIAKPFERRTRENRLPADRPLIPAETEAVVDRGLDFLARAQLPDGRWSLGRFPGGTPADAPKLQSDTAATGLALLSFLGAGHDHFDGRHRDTVRKGLEFLLSVQKPDGDLYIPSDQLSNSCAWLYSHGIATMALCEAVGMTGDEIVKPAAEKACGFIVAAQHPERGGWRYTPRSDADLSVSGWMLVALRSGQLAGLTIDGRPLDGVRTLLDTATAPASAGRPVYLYNPRKPDQRPSQSSSACMTALGTLMRLHTGWTASDQRVVDAARTLETATPAYGTREQKIRDCYLWYYASQVLVHTGGDGWDRWYRSLREQLAARQETTGEKRGSWDPLGAVPDRWGLYGGRLYVTTLHLLTLEVPARRLPTYSLGGD